MTVLRQSPYLLPFEATVAAEVLAHNARGWSVASPVSTSGPTIQTEPQQMAAPTRGPASSDTQVQAEWTALSSPADGDSPVLSYELQWDQGNSTWVSLAGSASYYTGTSYTVALGITTGSTYQFQVRASNKWGWGAFSPVTPIVAASAPSQMATVTTSIDPATGGVQISWTSPSSNGANITSYYIEIQDSSGVWRTETTDCAGNSSAVFLAGSCIIPMSVLTSAPFSLTLGTLVQVTASAINAYGQSTPSAVNTVGATISTVPVQMSPPTRGSATSESQLQVNWAPLTGTGTGNSAILSYSLYWDNGSGTPSI